MKNLKELLRPPWGREVRKVAGIFTLWVGIPRLIPGASFGQLKFADPVVYGILMTTVGILLMVTCLNGYRTTMAGKIVAGIAFVSWVMLAAATTSLTSFGLNVTVAVILLMEVWKNGRYDG